MDPVQRLVPEQGRLMAGVVSATIVGPRKGDWTDGGSDLI